MFKLNSIWNIFQIGKGKLLHKTLILIKNEYTKLPQYKIINDFNSFDSRASLDTCLFGVVNVVRYDL